MTPHETKPTIIYQKQKWVGGLLNCVVFGLANFYIGEIRKGIVKLILLYLAVIAFVTTLGLWVPFLPLSVSDLFGLVTQNLIWILLAFSFWDGYKTVARYNNDSKFL